MKKLIFFDLDGTLTTHNTWYDFNLFFGMSEQEDQTLLDWYKRGIISYSEWDELIVKVLRDRNQCTKQRVAEFLSTAVPRSEARDVIAACKEKGYLSIILSGTMRQIAEHFKNELGADFSYTTSEIIFDDNGDFIGITNDKDEGPAKLRIFEKLCSEHGVDPTDTICVGDSRNDLEMFMRTKKAILIGDYAPLKDHAWKQIQGLDELKEIL